jgi:hypothetical protein
MQPKFVKNIITSYHSKQGEDITYKSKKDKMNEAD